jgi:hypothetical protein
MAEEIVEPVVNEDAELDKSLEESLSTLKAGNVPLENKAEAPIEVAKEEPNGEAPVVSKEDAEFRIPNIGKDAQGKFESDLVYEKRIELMDLVKKRKAAVTDEQREALKTQIKDTRKELGTLNNVNNGVNNQLNSVVDTKIEVEEDESLKADRDRLKQLGGATKEDIQEIIRQERVAIDTKSTLDNFIGKYPEFQDVDVREVFFDFVDSNYNWSNKTGKELMTVLEFARQNMFSPAETIQERVLKGANVAEKINAMQFPGGAVAKQGYSPDMQRSIDELKATGMSEEKALQLLSD